MNKKMSQGFCCKITHDTTIWRKIHVYKDSFLYFKLTQEDVPRFLLQDNTCFVVVKKLNLPVFADLLYKSNLNTGSVLEYALAFTSAALDKYCSKWSAAPKTGFIDITTSKDFYRIYSGLQIGYLEESAQSLSNQELFGDSVAWGGCTIVYLLGQQLPFELFDFSYQVLNIAEAEDGTVVQTHKNSHYMQGWESLIESMKKARRLNNHVFSMLKARCPLEDKTACAIKQSGAPLHRIKFENTVSAFETLPQKGAVN